MGRDSPTKPPPGPPPLPVRRGYGGLPVPPKPGMQGFDTRVKSAGSVARQDVGTAAQVPAFRPMPAPELESEPVQGLTLPGVAPQAVLATNKEWPPRSRHDGRIDSPVPESAPSSDPRWERPTETKRRRIEATVGPVTYPPESHVGKRWSPAGVVMVFGAFGAMCVTVGGVVGPLLVKPDLSGYVKLDRLNACEAKIDARADSYERAAEELRKQVGRCYQQLGDCRSQTGAQEQVIESMGKPKRR